MCVSRVPRFLARSIQALALYCQLVMPLRAEAFDVRVGAVVIVIVVPGLPRVCRSTPAPPRPPMRRTERPLFFALLTPVKAQRKSAFRHAVECCTVHQISNLPPNQPPTRHLVCDARTISAGRSPASTVPPADGAAGGLRGGPAAGLDDLFLAGVARGHVPDLMAS